MKTIQSDGGPIIGIERRHLSLWLGTDGCRFSSANTIYKSDYQWICALIHSRDQTPERGAIFQGKYSQIIVLSQPFETSSISREDDICLIAQVEYADENWSFSNLSKQDFELPNSNCKSHQFSLSTSEEFVFFDAAIPGKEIIDDCLTMSLKSGRHELKTSYISSRSSGLFFFTIKLEK